MGSELNGEYRGINDPDVRQAVNFQPGIDDTSLVLRQHSKGIRRVELGLNVVGDKGIDIRVGSDSRTGADFTGEDSTEWRSSCNLPSKLDSLPHQRDICRVGQASRVEGRGIEGVVGGDVQPSLAVWVLEGELDGDRLVATCEVSGGVEQKLDLTDRAQEEVLGVSKVESLVTFDHTWVLAGELGDRVVEETENILLERDSIVI